LATKPPGMHDIITTLSTRSWLLALAGAAVIGAQSVAAQTAANSKHDRTVRSRIALTQVSPNLDAGRLQVKLVEVTYPPGGFSAPHTHPFPVVAGALQVQVKGGPEAIYKAGESFYEAPNGEHLISANASQQQPAKFIACFVCDGDKPLLLPIARTQPKETNNDE
jgi:quercetin dioxygenase-like cupin family protein